MRSFAALAVVAALAALPALAQEAPAPAPTPPAAGLPKGPIPYTALNPQRSRPATAPARPAATSAATTTPAPVASGVPSTAATPLPPAELQAFVDGVVRDAMAREHIAGVTVSIVQNGQVILKKGYGFAGLRPQRAVDPDRTLFRVGSISKTFTWIALMNEVEAGRIRIDAPVNLYLPERLQIKDQGYSQPVRIIHLMQHAPGFEDRALGHLFEKRFDRVRPLTEYLRQERPRRVFAPGAVSSYSNYGAGLAGEAVTYISDKTYERVIEDEILVPLGLWRTTFREPHPPKTGIPAPMRPDLLSDIATGYHWTPTGFEPRPYEYIGQIAPAGSASSTAGDMARYMLMQLGGGTLDGVTIYGPRAATAFRTPLRRTPPGVNGWAHGFIVTDLPGGHRGYGHQGATLSFMSNMMVVPSLNLGVFISTNTETGSALAKRLPERIVQQFYATPQAFPRPGAPGLVDQRKAFQGYYLGTRRAYSGLEGFVGRLTNGVAVSVTPEGRLVAKGFDTVTAYAPEGDLTEGRFISTVGSDRIAFRLVEGRARYFEPAWGGMRYERVGPWNQPSVLLVLAVLTLAAAVATPAGLFFRNRREFRETTIQSRASLVQTIQAALWVISAILFMGWSTRTGDFAQIMYGWPGLSLTMASACALVAAGLTVISLIVLPAIWRGGRRVDSWTSLRKAAFTLTALIYSAFSALLWTWGALSPWSG